MSDRSEWPNQPFLSGSWAVLCQPGELVAMDCEAGEEVSLRGAICSGDWSTTLESLRQLGGIRPDLQRLHTALTSGARQALTYGTVLGRSGWEILFLELTGQCNERCRHCYAESSPERKEQLSWPEIEAVVREAKTLGVRRLQLTGGDPLVSRHCLAAARLARDLGVPEIEIYTNGLALTDSLADELCGLGATFAMSFYSHRPEVHDAVTGTVGSQRRTLAAMARVLARGSGLRVSLISTADNRADIADTIELLEQVGVARSQMGLDEERGVGRGTFADGGDLVPHALLEQVGPTPHAGFAGSGKLCVSYRAEVLPCIFSRSERLGSLREASLEQLLETPLTLRTRRSGLALAPARARLTCVDCRVTESLLGRLAPVQARAPEP
jgi:MoaA/NifB/PqqE/SkfB family radical SAM enzyme